MLIRATWSTLGCETEHLVMKHTVWGIAKCRTWLTILRDKVNVKEKWQLLWGNNLWEKPTRMMKWLKVFPWICGIRTYRDLTMTVQLSPCMKLVCSAIQVIVEDLMVENFFKKTPIILRGKLHEVIAHVFSSQCILTPNLRWTIESRCFHHISLLTLFFYSAKQKHLRYVHKMHI